MNKKIGKNIRQLRETYGYSQDYMANEMEITQSAYGKLENGNIKITIDRLEKISIILKTDIFTLLISSNNNSNAFTEEKCQEMQKVFSKIIDDKNEEISFLRKLLEIKIKKT